MTIVQTLTMLKANEFYELNHPIKNPLDDLAFRLDHPAGSVFFDWCMLWLDSEHGVFLLGHGLDLGSPLKAFFQHETYSDLSQILVCFQQVGADPCTNGCPFTWARQ